MEDWLFNRSFNLFYLETLDAKDLHLGGSGSGSLRAEENLRSCGICQKLLGHRA